MADNVAITPGAGAAVSTDEITTLNGESVDAQHVQRVLLALSEGNGAASDVTDNAPLYVTFAESNAVLKTDVGYRALIDIGGEFPVYAVRVLLHNNEMIVKDVNSNYLNLTSSGKVRVDIEDPFPVDILSGPTGEDAFQIQGPVAHDEAAANYPVLGGGYAANAEPAAVANGDVARLLTDLVGKLITLPYANPENYVAGKTAAITDTTRTAVLAAPGAGVRNYVTHLLITNSHATVGTYVKIEDGTTEIYGGYAAPAGGGFSVTLPVPLRLSANAALNVTCGTTGANVYASASGYKGI